MSKKKLVLYYSKKNYDAPKQVMMRDERKRWMRRDDSNLPGGSTILKNKKKLEERNQLPKKIYFTQKLKKYTQMKRRAENLTTVEC